ncbi:MAG: thioesterase [Moraxellaceae bacterium]|nr:MAG: thioesterase [Moraxellaceae bacterium]
MTKPPVGNRSDYDYHIAITTRWSDNDLYGHVNNVTYYSYFDSVANTYLIEEGGLDIHDGDIIAYVVNSGCNYFSPIAFPEKLVGGLRVNRLGTSSVEYGIAIFKGGSDIAVAEGHFVHVFVDRATDKSVPIPETLRVVLAKLKV